MNEEFSAYRELGCRGGVADLSERTKLVIRGADRVRYLNGQVSSNVAELEIGHTQPACVTTAKGRLCAEVMITALLDSLLVDADAILRETLSARLERYVVADDVTVEQHAEDTCLLHVLGREPPMVSALENAAFHGARRFGMDGWDCWTDAASLSRARPELRFSMLSHSLLESIRIERGIPRWGFELDENTLPPEAGLDRTHIDYHKGCYVGQEVISRLRSVGHVNRQLVGFISQTDEPLVPFSGVFLVEEPKRQVGQITSAAWSFALEKHLALGYLKCCASAGNLVSCSLEKGAQQVPLIAQTLPFVI